jgi:Na+/H+ antiporter NhaD/arsenite permease-like protein
MTLAVSSLFIIGYLLIAFEHIVKVNKAAIALLTGVLCWTLFMFTTPDPHAAIILLSEQIPDIAGILFFLMGAMTIVEIIDSHNGFDAVTSLLASGAKRRILWLSGLVSFFLSAVLDNLTTTIVMVSLLSKVLPKRSDLLLFIGMVIIAVNAGGAWSSIGDVTTTMLWIGGRITSLSIVKALFVPCLVCTVVPLAWLSLLVKNEPEKHGLQSPSAPGSSRPGATAAGAFVLSLGIGALLFVPVFKSVTHLPPFFGMIFGLGVLWVATEFLHRKRDEEYRQSRSVVRALQRIDLPSILFFLGILLGVSALQVAGVLPGLAAWLDRTVKNSTVIVLIIGIISSIVDNVPLVAACIRMYPLTHFPADHHFWSFLSYCAGTGGSVLIIGSAAGIAAMGIAKINFFWYLRKITPIALAGYFAGAIVYLVLNVFL